MRGPEIGFCTGLVGVGLCHLFASSGCEDPKFQQGMDTLANHMGLFLQKTNIIRDYLEDIMEEPAPRMFWPREVWGRYAGELDEFKDKSNRCEFNVLATNGEHVHWYTLVNLVL